MGKGNSSRRKPLPALDAARILEVAEEVRTFLADPVAAALVQAIMDDNAGDLTDIKGLPTRSLEELAKVRQLFHTWIELHERADRAGLLTIAAALLGASESLLHETQQSFEYELARAEHSATIDHHHGLEAAARTRFERRWSDPDLTSIRRLLADAVDFQQIITGRFALPDDLSVWDIELFTAQGEPALPCLWMTPRANARWDTQRIPLTVGDLVRMRRSRWLFIASGPAVLTSTNWYAPDAVSVHRIGRLRGRMYKCRDLYAPRASLAAAVVDHLQRGAGAP